MRIGLISDTHGFVHPEALALFANVNLILHAGDIGSEDVIHSLEALAPVQAVVGNMDSSALRSRYPERHRLNVEERRILLVHRPPVRARIGGRKALLEELQADIVVHGHTHRAENCTRGGFVFINPGSAGSAKIVDRPSVALLTLKKDRQPEVEIVPMARLYE